MRRATSRIYKERATFISDNVMIDFLLVPKYNIINNVLVSKGTSYGKPLSKLTYRS